LLLSSQFIRLRVGNSLADFVRHAVFLQLLLLHELAHHVVQHANFIAVSAMQAANVPFNDPKLLPVKESPSKGMPPQKPMSISGESGYWWERACFQQCMFSRLTEKPSQGVNSPVSGACV